MTQALRFVSDLLGSTTATFDWIEHGRPESFVRQDVSSEFHQLYLSEMQAYDPLSADRLLGSEEHFASLDVEGAKGDPEKVQAYQTFLIPFGLMEAIELVFRRDG